MASKVVVSFIFLILCYPLGIQSSTSNSWIKAGYYTSQTELPVSDINSALFTHLIFAFAYVNSSSYELSINSSDSGKFSTFTNLVKRKNPSVATILSIWVGREQSSIFFSKLSQLSNRKSFIESSISVARINGFDGLDLCGIEPSTSLNMTVLGTLLEEWRVATDSEVKTKNKPRLLLVMLAHPRPSLHSVSYPIDAMKNNLDWVHIRSYDYSVPTKTNITFPQAALYDPSNQELGKIGLTTMMWRPSGPKFLMQRRWDFLVTTCFRSATMTTVGRSLSTRGTRWKSSTKQKTIIDYCSGNSCYAFSLARYRHLLFYTEEIRHMD